MSLVFAVTNHTKPYHSITYHAKQGGLLREAIQSILKSYEKQMDPWEFQCQDTERIRVLQAIMPTFVFFFGFELRTILPKQIDNLSRALQSCKMSAAQGNALALEVVSTMAKDRDRGGARICPTRGQKSPIRGYKQIRGYLSEHKKTIFR